MALGSGAAYSMNSKPSVPIGLSHSSGMAVSRRRFTTDCRIVGDRPGRFAAGDVLKPAKSR